MKSSESPFNPNAFVERLREIRKATGRTGADIATQGEITKQTFSGYLHTGRLPSAAVLANWVFRLGINANWLLTGEGPIFREDLDKPVDPVVQRVAVVVHSMRESGAEEGDIIQAVRAMMDGEMAKRENAGRALAPHLRPLSHPENLAKLAD